MLGQESVPSQALEEKLLLDSCNPLIEEDVEEKSSNHHDTSDEIVHISSLVEQSGDDEYESPNKDYQTTYGIETFHILVITI